MSIMKTFRKIDRTKQLISPNIADQMRLHYAENYDSKSIDSNLIVYETRDGKSIVDSPYAIFLYLATNSEYNQFKHVWIVENSNDQIKSAIPKQLLGKVSFVYRNTLDYVDKLLEAKYLISNSTFESFFVKKTDQIYINTWHGTPLKSMGFDIPGKVSNSQNVLRNFLMTDYIISPNTYTSNIFINSYKLHDIYTGEILEGGYPRIDLTLNSDRDKIIEKIQSFGTKVEKDKPTILYSPTWKGSSMSDIQDDIDQIIDETLKLVDEFSDKYNILVKVHPFIFSNIKEDQILDNLVVDYIDANEVLSVVDILITDYSSIFFDFLVTNKPIIFYSWDKDLYNIERGMYLEEAQLPGPTAENINELISYIHNKDVYFKEYSDRYRKLSSEMTKYDDGKVTQKYIDYIFNQQTSPNMIIRKVGSNKKKLLIFPGGMRNNGITSSLLNLVNNIDYDAYDVTLICNPISSNEINENLKALNDKSRLLFRFGKDILTRKERMINQNFTNNGVPSDKRYKYPFAGYQREMNRLTANLKFDVAIDFSGYSYFWGRHILAANADKRVVFMHNDLMADSMREVNGKMPMYKDLHGLFSIYYQFDKLLSVSPMTRDVNLEKLSEFVTKDQMSFVLNSIDINKILNSENASVEDTDNVIVRRALIRPVVSGIVESYKNIESIKNQESFEVELHEDDKLIQYAKIELNKQTFIKVSVNNVYIGWILEKYTDRRKVEVEKIENYHGFATVSRNLDFPIWKDLKTNTNSDEIVSYVRHFKNRYLEIKKVAYTNNGRYFQVRYNKKDLGWVSPKPLMRFHKTHKFSPLNQYFLTRMRSQQNKIPVYFTDKVEIVSTFVRILNKESVHIWSEPKGTTNAIEVSLSEEYLNSYFKCTEVAYINNEKYCKLLLSDNSFIGYINENDIEYISEVQFEESKIQDEINNVDLPVKDLCFQKVAEIDENYINFVNMGRLSPEKNQEGLIRAFGKFNQKVPKSRLYILGMGPLKDELVKLVQSLQLEGKVILLGHLKRPFEFMRKMTYFVLPSFYEGQPMVLLEALTLDMKILASNIPANINVLGANEQYGMLTQGTSEEDIFNGLNIISSSNKKFDSFDYFEYNQKAIQNFYEEIK